MFGAAVIGCGKIGSEFADDPKQKNNVYTHAHAYSHCAGVELIAVCDIVPEKAAACGKRWGVPSYTNYKEMMTRWHPDVVSICTPDETHKDILIDILQFEPKGVIIEKPLAPNLRDAKAIFQAVMKSNSKILVNYTRRYLSCDLKKLTSDLGKPIYMNGVYSGDLMHTGTHLIDFARYLIGEIDLEVGTEGAVVFRNDCAGHIRGISGLPYGFFEISVLYENGRLIMADSGHRIELYDIVDSPYYTGYRSLELRKSFDVCMNHTTLNAVADMVRCLKTGDRPRCDFYDGYRDVVIAERLEDASH